MYYLCIDLLVCLHWKIRRFTAFLDSKIHTRLAIVTANELGLAFPHRNLPEKFRPDPSTFYLVIVVTDRQPDKQTNKQTNVRRWKHNPRESFRGDNNWYTRCDGTALSWGSSVVRSSIMYTIMLHNSPHSMWKKVHTMCINKSTMLRKSPHNV